jgi:hypothetical protein
LLSLAFIVTISGPQFDTVIINDDVIGGTAGTAGCDMSALQTEGA